MTKMKEDIFTFNKEIRGGLKKIKSAKISSNLTNQLLALNMSSQQLQTGIESVIKRRQVAKLPDVETIEELLSEVVTDQILRNNLR